MSGVLPSLTPKDVARTPERMGFLLYRQKGSHRIYVKDAAQVVVPFHTQDIKKGTLHQIIKGTGISVEEFLKHL